MTMNSGVLALKSVPEIGVFISWRGSPDHIRKFMDICKWECVSPGCDSTTALAGMIGVITGQVHNPKHRRRIYVRVGALHLMNFNNVDNGLYWIGDDWEIHSREYVSQEVDR